MKAALQLAAVLVVLVRAGRGSPETEAAEAESEKLSFPADFLFGAATASYQVEGGWNADGKGEGMWDRFSHEHPELILDGSNGDVACDSYHKYKEDVQLLKNLNMNYYRFSISWPRILPKGSVNNINEAGVRYYHNLIDELLAHNITPMVTMYHWDLPQAMLEIGGWPSEFIVGYFLDYAELLFREYGDKVKYWMIMNEPMSVCGEGWGYGDKAPGIKDDGRADYLCGHNILKAHGKAYRLYKNKFSHQNGSVGIALNSDYIFPDTNSADDLKAAERVQHFQLGWFANPIFGDGDYPNIMRELVGNASTRQNFTSSRLPTFTVEEMAELKGSADFFGINSYTSKAARPAAPDLTPGYYSKTDDSQAAAFFREEWETTVADWLCVVPEGFRGLLNFIKDNYGNPRILITEQGYPDYDGLKDVKRTSFYQRYLLQLLKAIHIDKVNVFGYTAWSLMDNYEWDKGYKHRFGIHYVDFKDPNRPRKQKLSAKFFQQVIDTRTVPDPMTIDFPDDSNGTSGALGLSALGFSLGLLLAMAASCL